MAGLCRLFECFPSSPTISQTAFNRDTKRPKCKMTLLILALLVLPVDLVVKGYEIYQIEKKRSEDNVAESSVSHISGLSCLHDILTRVTIGMVVYKSVPSVKRASLSFGVGGGEWASQ